MRQIILQNTAKKMINQDKGGRPPHTPTERDRKTVQAMASYGVPQDDIAFDIKIDPRVKT